jgi:hypothetical protein
LLALQEAVEKGVRNGYWEMEYDENADADIIVLLERKESSAPRATVEKRPHI